MALYLKDAAGKRVKVAGLGPSGKDATINGVVTLKLAATGGITGSQSGDTYTLDGSGKQDKLTGKQGQLVGFDSTGQAVPQEVPPGSKRYTASIGTTWTEDKTTGAKWQNVAIAGVKASQNGYVDHINTHPRTADGYAKFVKEENQFLNYITNGDAETYDGGVKFYIYGDAPDVAIPIMVEVS